MTRPRRGGDEDEWVMDGRTDPEGVDDGRGTEQTAYALEADDAGDDSDDDDDVDDGGGGGGGGGNLGTCEEAGDSI